jgi:glycogen debranching enzyme
MRKTIKYGIVAALSAIFLFACRQEPIIRAPIDFSLDEGSDMILSPNELFEKLAIDVPKGERAQYVYGDNIAGYLEGYTYNYRRGQGYIMNRSAVFTDFASFVNDSLNDKTRAKLARLYPYGVRNVYVNGSYDEFIMHNKMYAMSLVVESPEPAKLSLLPMLNLRARTSVIERKGNVVVFSPSRELPREPDYPVYTAVSSDLPFDYREGDREREEDIARLRIQRAMVTPVFSSRDNVTNFTIHIAFGFTAEEAFEKAREMVKVHSVEIQKKKFYDFLTKSYVWTDDLEYNRALMWAKLSAYSMYNEEYGENIWAGLPWFKDTWGRDTFIALPGTLLVSGEFDEALGVIMNYATLQNRGQLSLQVEFENDDARLKTRNFIRENLGKQIAYKDGVLYHSVSREYVEKQDELQAIIDRMAKEIPGISAKYELIFDKNFGRIPNRVTSMENVIYNTTDGTPWFLREMYEYMRYTGDMQFAKDIYETVIYALNGSIDNYVDEYGFLTHDDADTWMDAKIAGNLPWSARGNRAIEIQVLWYTALRTGEFLAKYNGDDENARKWGEVAERLKRNFPRFFWDTRNNRVADRIRKDNSRDYMIRPNQLMAVSVPFENRFLETSQEAYIVKNAVSELLFPYGIASLSQNHPLFHPKHDDHWHLFHKDAAYHNGTIWGWNAGFTVTAMTRFGYTELAYELTKNLAEQILYMGCRGSMSENLDGHWNEKKEIKLSGTFSQAWSVSEYTRNGYQDFVGFRPNLLEDEILVIPAIPSEWNEFVSSLAFGMNGKARFNIKFDRNGSSQTFEFSFTGYDKPLDVIFIPLANKTRYRVSFKLEPGHTVKVVFDESNGNAVVDGNPVARNAYIPSQHRVIGDLKFQTPDLSKTYGAMTQTNFLQGIIERGEYDKY